MANVDVADPVTASVETVVEPSDAVLDDNDVALTETFESDPLLKVEFVMATPDN